MNGVVLTLKQNGEQKSPLITIGSYLFSKGYRVQAISEPRFISYEKPFATYSIDVEVEYLNDYKGKEKKIHTTETVWVHADSRLLSKIKSKDPFISARVCNFEYDDK